MTTKPHFLTFLAVAAMTAASARAGAITLSFDNPDQSGLPGQTIQYFGTITNTGTDTVWLNSDGINLAAPAGDFTISDFPFFANTPDGFLAGGGTTGDLEIFDVTVSNPFPDAVDTPYAGTFTLLGGGDPNAGEVLTSASFSATATSAAPEPGSLVLLALGLGGLGLSRRSRRASSAAA